MLKGGERGRGGVKEGEVLRGVERERVGVKAAGRRGFCHRPLSCIFTLCFFLRSARRFCVRLQPRAKSPSGTLAHGAARTWPPTTVSAAPLLATFLGSTFAIIFSSLSWLCNSAIFSFLFCIQLLFSLSAGGVGGCALALSEDGQYLATGSGR